MNVTTADVELPVGRSRISWGAVFAATFISLGLWVLLYAFGLAVGLTALTPTDAGSWRAMGIGTGVWAIIAPLIALFVGGLVASRESTVIRRIDAAVHGAVLWGLTTVLGLFVIGSLMGALVGGAAGLIGGTVGIAAEVGGGVAAGQPAQDGQGRIMQALGLSASDLVEPINRRLRAEGHPEVTAAGLQAALQDVVDNALRTGSLERADIVAALSANTALSQPDAQAVAADLEQQWAARRAQLAAQAEAAADATARAMWALAIALLLSLFAAIGGAVLGIGGKEHRRREEIAHGRFAPAPS
jgi:hypothetical protein